MGERVEGRRRRMPGGCERERERERERDRERGTQWSRSLLAEFR